VLGTAEVSLLEMTNAYTAFANSGVRAEDTVILEVEDKFNNVIYKHSSEFEEVISPETAYFITSFLSDEDARRITFGNSLSFPFEVALKTGTTEDFRDAWTIGYTPDFVVGVWVGNNDNSPMHNAPGSQTAAPAFRNIMTYLVNFGDPSEFRAPENVVAVAVCRHNGLRAANTSTSSAIVEYFEKGNEPTRQCVTENKRDEDKEDENETDIIQVSAPEDALPPPNIGGSEEKEKDEGDDEKKKEGEG